MKKILALLSCFFSISCYAVSSDSPQTLQSIQMKAVNGSCGVAPPTSDPKFCASFRTIANCNCTQRGGMPQVCNDMNVMLKMMISTYGSLANACSAQSDVPQQVCIDEWNYYISHCE